LFLEAYVNTDKLNRFWLAATFLLIIIIVASGLSIWVRRDQGQPISISSATTPQIQGEVYIEGAVAKPGTYPLQAGESIDGLIQASGGADENADFSRVQVYIPRRGETAPAQKIDINQADAWLLQALPGIGQVRAQAIIDYRQQNGPFRSIEELTQVPGISESNFRNVKNLITAGK
jgi:competence protein ComEA